MNQLPQRPAGQTISTAPHAPFQRVWDNNPNLRSLLLVLIFVFFACGMVLLVLMQAQSSYRRKIYEQTEAALPKHSGFRILPEVCRQLPEELAKNPALLAWAESHGLRVAEFCGHDIQPLAGARELPLSANAAAACQQDAKTIGGGLFLPAPKTGRWVCMGNFGEPDSDVWLAEEAFGVQRSLASCGTPCLYESGFWLDQDRFVLLERREDGEILAEPSYLVSVFDLLNDTAQPWVAAGPGGSSGSGK